MRRKRIVGEVNLCDNEKCHNAYVKQYTNDEIQANSLICPYCGFVMTRYFIWQGIKFKGDIRWPV